MARAKPQKRPSTPARRPPAGTRIVIDDPRADEHFQPPATVPLYFGGTPLSIRLSQALRAAEGTTRGDAAKALNEVLVPLGEAVVRARALGAEIEDPHVRGLLKEIAEL